ncbi:hypothetical protein MOQ72_41920 [Saccharopolyspora sp. K220]|uniref:hypothetical protein n=1 Tax=Saccharopolyspora soli TaxID=2926618 RepID=UPI001F5AB291|nr:hypothetical protein [Saccharopolyspora soli]MCI2423977.1 hypothetical protein [Saccharopolyspora soli]
MGKQVIPGVSSGRGVLGKVVGAAVMLALLGLIVKSPTDAAALVKGLLDWFMAAVDGLSTFFRGLL